MEYQVQKRFSDKEFKVESDEFNSRAEKFKLIFNASPDMIFIISHNGLILDANKSALTEYGYNHKQAFGMGFEHLLTNATDIKKARKLFESVKSGAEIDYEWMTQSKNGKKFPVDVRLRNLSLNDDDEKPAIVLFLRNISQKQKAEEAISSLARATNILHFEDFLKESVKSLAKLYGTKFAFVGRLQPDKKHVSTLVVWAGDRIVDNFTYSLEGTPCKDVLDLKVELISDSASERYPSDEMLIQMGIQSYFGHPMVAEEKMVGLVSVMDDKRLDVEPWTSPILGLFANRLAVEIERFEMNKSLQDSKDNLEELVQQRTSELKAVNNELDAFNSSIAHDLRTPIHAISSYCQILYEECAPKIDELGGGEYLDYIKDTAKDMAELIENLLQFSRITKVELAKENINVSLMVTEIAQKLEHMNKDRNIKIEIEDDVFVNADRGSMIVLLDNLLHNAWKYTGNKKDATVKFGKYNTDAGSGFYIKDNGAGFDMASSEELFEVFKRLHKDSEFVGTGVGLATVHRIIGKHNGKIWADAEINNGATFYVNLPEK